MVVLVVEDGTGKSDANSYTTAAEGDIYHEKHLFSDDWDNATLVRKEEALMMSTRLIDENIEWQGARIKKDQALSWPRANVPDRDGFIFNNTEIPTELKDAIAEFARWLLMEDRTAEDDAKGFKKLKAGSLAMEVDRFDRASILPNVVVRMLVPLGNPRSKSKLKLIRT